MKKITWAHLVRSHLPRRHWSVPWVAVILTVILGAGSAIAVMSVASERSDSAAGRRSGRDPGVRALGANQEPGVAEPVAVAAPDAKEPTDRVAGDPSRSTGPVAKAAAARPSPPVVPSPGDGDVPSPSFSLSCGRETGLMVCRVFSHNGFSGQVDLACESPYENLTCNFLPPTLTVSPGGSAAAFYNNPPGVRLLPGRYEVQAVATSNGVTVTAPVVLEVDVPEEYLAIRCSNQYALHPSEIVDVPAGEQVAVGCTVSSSYASEISVVLKCPAVGGMTCTAPNPVVMPAYGSVEIQMTVDVPPGTPPDGYRFHVTHDKRVPEMYHGSWFQIQVV